MDYKNDERYWNIKLLNKWFAISSILFLISIAWMFLDDNDDEFKIYQRDIRKLESTISKNKLSNELKNVGENSVRLIIRYTACTATRTENKIPNTNTVFANLMANSEGSLILSFSLKLLFIVFILLLFISSKIPIRLF